MHDHNINSVSYLFASLEDIHTIYIPLMHDELLWLIVHLQKSGIIVYNIIWYSLYSDFKKEI